MNKELLESQWLQIRDILKDKFSNLTEDDIRQINGRYDQLVAKLQQKYGYSREEAEDRIKSWNFDRFGSTFKGSVVREDKLYREDNLRKEEDNSSLLKWLAAIGIPLLLLGAYLLSPIKTPELTTKPAIMQEQVMVEAPADRAISVGLRNALISPQSIGYDLRNVQIATHNGIVTLSGTVPNAETRDYIASTTQNFSGVREVIDNLQIR